MSPRSRPHPVGELRRSQIVTTFGPGAMLDLVDRSVLVGGLEVWRGVDFREPIVEDRLKAKVEEKLGVPNVRFFAPPVEEDQPGARMAHVGVVEFPTWFLAQVDRTIERNGRTYRTRPLVPGKRLDGGKWLDENRKRVDVVPVRFVQACPRGHISDIDWFGFVGAEFSESLWLDESGAGNDFAEIHVRRERNGATRQLADSAVLDPKRRPLGTCRGTMPWIGPHDREACPEPSRLLVRSASNAYFPQLQSVIAIPDGAAALRDAVEAVYEDFLSVAESHADIERERKKPRVAKALEGLDDADVWREVERRKAGKAILQDAIKRVEVRTLRATHVPAKGPLEDAEFSARSRDVAGLKAPMAGVVDRILLVDRLREVVAQVGFTRFEAAVPDVDGELSLGVRRASLAKDVRWLPAVDNRGEGVFLGISSEALDRWAERPSVREREKVLLSAFDAWRAVHGVNKAEFPGIRYYALHSLAHLLITEVSLTCGYTASSIRERVYVGADGNGVLLFTAGSGSEGTLGGLVEVGRRIEDHLQRALEKAVLCSNDPVCSEHQPDLAEEDRFLHGAACHGCLLIAETSCERFNQGLDRALVVPTLAAPDCALFTLAPVGP